mmetsp:Transcript_1250/g.4145  ORF Transcript_1250/g.4145 Transcript_1250/m.4145 type:complete len:263 (-) Transcript_1250:1122-1910(-)
MSPFAHPASVNFATAASRSGRHGFFNRAHICECSNSVFPHITCTCARIDGSGSGGGSSPSFGACPAAAAFAAASRAALSASAFFFSSSVFAGSSGSFASTVSKSATAARNSASASFARASASWPESEPFLTPASPLNPAAAHNSRARSYRRCARAIFASWKSGLTLSAASYRPFASSRRSTTSSYFSAEAMAAPGGPPSSSGGSRPPSMALRAPHMWTLPQLKSASAAASWNLSPAILSISSASARETCGSSASLHLSRPSA